MPAQAEYYLIFKSPCESEPVAGRTNGHAFELRVRVHLLRRAFVESNAECRPNDLYRVELLSPPSDIQRLMSALRSVSSPRAEPEPQLQGDGAGSTPATDFDASVHGFLETL